MHGERKIVLLETDKSVRSISTFELYTASDTHYVTKFRVNVSARNLLLYSLSLNVSVDGIDVEGLPMIVLPSFQGFLGFIAIDENFNF